MATVQLILLLLGIAFATIGATGYAIFGPLTCRHLKDRGLAGEMNESALSATGALWILRGGYRRHEHDRSLRQLAIPARIMAWLTLSGLLLVAANIALRTL